MNRPHSHRNLLWSGHWPVVFHKQTGTLLYSLFVSWSFYWQSNGRVDGFTMCTLSDAYDIQSKVLAFAFGLSAEIERNLISQRTKEALARLKYEGKHLGRPIGSKNKSHKLEGMQLTIKGLIENGMSKTQIAQKTGVSRSTLYLFLKSF